MAKQESVMPVLVKPELTQEETLTTMRALSELPLKTALAPWIKLNNALQKHQAEVAQQSKAPAKKSA